MQKSIGAERTIAGPARVCIAESGFEHFSARAEIPKRRSEKPRITLKPTSEQFSALSHFPNGDLTLTLSVGEEDGVSTILQVDELWILSAERTYWSSDFQECTAEVDPRVYGLKTHTLRRRPIKPWQYAFG